MTVFYNLVASWWNDFWSKITVLEPLLLQTTVNTNVLRRFLQQIHPPTATRSEKKQVTKLTWPLSSASVPVSHDPTSAEVQSHVKQCLTNLMDCECMYTVKCQCDASHGSMMTDVGHEGWLGSTYSILPCNLISFSLGPSLEILHVGHCKSLQSESFMILAGWAPVDTPGFGTRIHMAWWCMWTLWTFFFFLLLFLLLN